jgi:hypothetical protein
LGPFLSTLVLIAVCTVIGIRLLAFARRTRGLPELLVGAAFVLAGTGGFGFALLGALLPVGDTGRLLLRAISAASLHCGVGCIAAFTWRVFRPADRAAAAFFAVLAALLLASLAHEIATRRTDRGAAGMQAVWSVAVGATVYLWAAIESGRYWLLLRRRLRLGIGDSFVAAQMVCWSTASLAIALGWIRDIVKKLSGGPEVSEVGSYVTTFLVLVCAIAYWLAFFPPGWFRRWATERARVTPGAA